MSIENHLPHGDSACAEIGEQLSAYLDGELPADARTAVEAHLRECPDCARLCTALQALRTDIAGAQLDPPPALHERVMAQVRREARMRRIRRFTAAASAAAAAMFCFVIIGGAMLRGMANKSADMAAPETAEAVLYAAKSVMGGDDGDGAAMTVSVPDGAFDLAPTGKSAEDVIEQSETQVAGEAGPAEAEMAATLPETTASPSVGVVTATLPEPMRILSRLDSTGTISGLSTSSAPDQKHNEAQVQAGADSLSAIFGARDARLAAEQVGTLCIVELGDAYTEPVYLVYDLTTELRLTLGDFLADADALTALGLDPEWLWRPTAAGLSVKTPDGEKLIAWESHPALTACVTRYAMTRQPLLAG